MEAVRHPGRGRSPPPPELLRYSVQQTARGALLRTRFRFTPALGWGLSGAASLLLLLIGTEAMTYMCLIFTGLCWPIAAVYVAMARTTPLVRRVRRSLLVSKRPIPGGTEPVLEVDGVPIPGPDVRGLAVLASVRPSDDDEPRVDGQVFLVTRRAAYLVARTHGTAEHLEVAHYLRSALGLPHGRIPQLLDAPSAGGFVWAVLFVASLFLGPAGSVYLHLRDRYGRWTEFGAVLAFQLATAVLDAAIAARLSRPHVERRVRGMGVEG